MKCLLEYVINFVGFAVLMVGALFAYVACTPQ